MRKASSCALIASMLVLGVSAAVAAQRQDQRESPIYGVRLPRGYRVGA